MIQEECWTKTFGKQLKILSILKSMIVEGNSEWGWDD